MKQKRSRKEREAAREEAIARLDELGAMTREARQNDKAGSHFTVWLRNGRRIEWWPGSRHWRDADLMNHTGEIEEFFQWVRTAA